MKNITLPISILIGCCVLAGTFYLTQVQKQDSIERQQKLEISNKNAEIQRQIYAEENEKSLAESAKKKIEADLKECLRVAANKNFDALDEVKYIMSRCNKVPNSDCITTLVRPAFDKAQSTYETDKNQCYLRFPIN